MSYAGEIGPPEEDGPQSESYGKPVPDQKDPATRSFWEAANRRELVIQRCKQCRQFHHPPVGLCWTCLSDELTFERVSGRGTVYSYVVVKDQRQAAFDGLTPYVVATVELEDAPGVFLRSNLPDVPAEQIVSGMPVQVDFDEIAPGVNLPQFYAISSAMRNGRT